MTKILKIILGIITGFVGLTAIGGGMAILTGVDKFPVEWLQGTPFKSYLIPAIILLVFVGGSSIFSTINLITGNRNALRNSIISGIILSGYILIEIVILKQDPPGPTSIEIFYLLLGIIISTLSLVIKYKPD